MTPIARAGLSVSFERRALTLAEMAISMVLVSVMIVAAVSAAAGAKRGERISDDRTRGHLLAQDLMDEILAQEYADDSYIAALKQAVLIDGTKYKATLGPETGESVTGDRSRFDDVDDYNGWSASPPQQKNGATLDYLTGWTRAVRVDYAKYNDLVSVKTEDEGSKLVTVTVAHDGVDVASLVAVRTLGPPPTEACCLPDGACADLLATVCASIGGTSQGPGTLCALADCDSSDTPNFLLVVGDVDHLTTGEAARKALIESWGFVIQLVDDSASQADFDDYCSHVAVAYVPTDVDDAELGDKLVGEPIGVVNEECHLSDNFGIFDYKKNIIKNEILTSTASHYIIEPLGTYQVVTIFSSMQSTWTSDGFVSASTNVVAYSQASRVFWYPSLGVIDAGGALMDGSPAAGRRVQLPWGDDSFNFSSLNANGQTVMKRAIQWAANMEE